MRRAGWMLLAALPAAGCMDFVPLSQPRDDGPDLFLFLESHNPGPGTAPDTLRVAASVSRAEGVAFADDTLRIAGRAVAREGRFRDQWGYSDTLLLPAGTLSGPVSIRLPVPVGDPLPLQEFGYRSVARGGPDVVAARAGADVLLPLHPGNADGLPAPDFETWNVTLQRGRGNAEFRTTSPLPASIIIPASLVPIDTASWMDVGLRSQRAFRADGAGTVYLAAEAILHWRVHIIP